MDKVLPYGSWPSPLRAEHVARASVRFGQLQACGDALVWSESRPAEQGRQALVRLAADGEPQDLLPMPWNARTRVHEYGGGAFVAAPDGRVFFCQFDDQRVHVREPDGTVRALTRLEGMRYADLVLDASRGRLIAVREDHATTAGEALATLVAIDLASGDERVLADGHDFYANPAPSPDGRHLAWLAWDHPNMPWDGCALSVAPFMPDGGLGEARIVAGSAHESIFQPAWSPQGELHFVSDRTGWWNLYREHEGRVEALCPMDAEFGEPQWVFGLSTYGFDPRVGAIVCTWSKNGESHLGRLDPGTRALTSFTLPFDAIRDVRVGAASVACFAGSPLAPEALVRVELERGTYRVLKPGGDTLPRGDVSVPEAIEVPSANGRTTHAWYYPPKLAGHAGPEGERPPLLVVGHGGPTAFSSSTLRLSVQYWTQRGFAVVDVNYGGSSGYGRAYRDVLKGAWGIVDVEDCIAAARFLAARGSVDPRRLAIRGGSAGGYTTLAALAFHDVFAAGASHYGVADLAMLAADTHKFESRYLDSLVGPWPEAEATYRERSPIHHVERIRAATIFFQGAEDRVVPPSQAEVMVAALRARGLPVAYLLFEGEQHGFRRAANIVRALEAELWFYGRVLGFTPADLIEPVPADNLPPPGYRPA